MAKFCSKCGNELKEGARFCSVCGNPVKQVQSAQSAATAAGTNEERQGVSSQQQGFTAQDMQYQQMAGSAAPVKKNKNLWLLAIPAAILVILLVIFGIKAVLSPAYLKPVKYMEKAFNKQDIDLMKKAVPDEYAAWMTDDIVDYMFDLDSDYKITIKVTDKEKIAKKVEDILNAKEKNGADEMYQQWKGKVTIVMEEPWGKINFSEKIMEE